MKVKKVLIQVKNKIIKKIMIAYKAKNNLKI
jgi:hypothetical protein